MWVAVLKPSEQRVTPKSRNKPVLEMDVNYFNSYEEKKCSNSGLDGFVFIIFVCDKYIRKNIFFLLDT